MIQLNIAALSCKMVNARENHFGCSLSFRSARRKMIKESSYKIFIYSIKAENRKNCILVRSAENKLQ